MTLSRAIFIPVVPMTIGMLDSEGVIQQAIYETERQTIPWG
jgi:hypothetical protein